jgi:cytoskeletal protein CcmA (bactofilin family)
MADNSSTNDYPTVLGADAKFKGQLSFEKGVRLLGTFEGEIASGGQLLVDSGAALNGDVKAGSIRIDGNVKGNLDAGAKVQLTESARVEGDVQAQRLEVAEGAILVGHCMVGVNGHSSKSESKSADSVKGSEASSSAGSSAKGKVPATAGKR